MVGTKVLGYEDLKAIHQDWEEGEQEWQILLARSSRFTSTRGSSLRRSTPPEDRDPLSTALRAP